jgi:hypothetical protein
VPFGRRFVGRTEGGQAAGINLPVGVSDGKVGGEIGRRSQEEIAFVTKL